MSGIRNKPYHIVNLSLSCFFLLIFIYSAVFSAEKNNHPLPSIQEIMTGEPGRSSGLSRAFSEIIRGEADSAAQYNPYALRIFVFFLIQLAMRPTASILLIRNVLSERSLAWADGILSLLLLVICFRPFFPYLN